MLEPVACHTGGFNAHHPALHAPPRATSSPAHRFLSARMSDSRHPASMV
jgi:hypothetical protein